MTREEAIEQLEVTEKANLTNGNIYLADAMRMAIEALQTEPLEVEAAKEQKAYNKGFDDCRRAVLDLLQMKYFGKDLYTKIYELPPVTPQKVGRWVHTHRSWEGISESYFVHEYMCSECRALSYFRHDSEHKIVNGRICPNCMARMEEGDAEC